MYLTYIDLLQHVAKQLMVGIDDVEMLLFSKAEELAKEIERMPMKVDSSL